MFVGVRTAGPPHSPSGRCHTAGSDWTPPGRDPSLRGGRPRRAECPRGRAVGHDRVLKLAQ